MINPYADRPVYKQLADILRALITSGELEPGDYLASEQRLGQEYAVGRDSVRSAIALLRAEGLVETHRPGGTRVRSRDVIEIDLELGSTVGWRVATSDECRSMRLSEGAHVAVVASADGESVIYEASRHIFRAI